MAAGLKTTRMRLQVHQEFLLHESDGPEDTVAWLTLRHRVMRDIFEVSLCHQSLHTKIRASHVQPHPTGARPSRDSCRRNHSTELLAFVVIAIVQ